MTGWWVLLGALTLTVVLALLHRRYDGRLRQTRAVARSLTNGDRTNGDRTDGTRTDGDRTDGDRTDGDRTDGDRTDGREDLRPLLPEAGERATLLQFSSAFCAPCRATRRILTEVAELAQGVAHVEIDAESNLDLVRRLNVLKTPTTLVLDAHGREVLRATGQPKKAAVLTALAEAVPS